MRLLPDTERLVLAILRPTVSASFGTSIPDNVATRLPFVVVRRVSGAALEPRFIDQPVINVDAWHTSRAAASDLADEVRAALVAAWERQTVTEHGHVASFAEQSGPSELRTGEQPDTVFRYQALYSIAIRPPRRG